MITSLSDYQQYKKICLDASNNNDIFEKFRSTPEYTTILEHVSEYLGNAYLEHIEHNNVIIDENILTILHKIDMLGSPKRYKFKTVGVISPTIIRYLSVASDIKSLYGSLDNKTVVEIGAGYGGQSMLLNLLYDIKSYVIVDLPETIELIKKFLLENGMCLDNYKFYTYPNIPVIESDFLISNYAFSECYKNIQDLYIENLINKSKNFYMIMNFMSNNVYSKSELVDRLDGELIISNESPESSPGNLLFYKITNPVN